MRADFAYTLPDGYSPAELAPLLCAGIIGYRALRRAELPSRRPARRLRIRRVRAPDRPGGAGPWRDGPRLHPLAARP
nr:hypothetical protein GCM10020092_068510 [Actinoplanes digitatis]